MIKKAISTLLKELQDDTLDKLCKNTCINEDGKLNFPANRSQNRAILKKEKLAIERKMESLGLDYTSSDFHRFDNLKR